MKRKRLLAFTMAVTIALSGCGIGTGEKENKNQVSLTETSDKIEGLSENYEPTGDLAKGFAKYVKYEVKNVDWNDNGTGKAEVVVSAPDMAEVLPDVIQKTIDDNKDEEDYEKLLEATKKNVMKKIKAKNCPTTETTVEMDAKKNSDDGKDYTLITNDEFESAITGNLEQLFIETLMEEFADEEE